MKAYVGWSIYVRTGTIRKLTSVHLPAIDEALEHIEYDWSIIQEEEHPGLYRIMNFQNFEAEHVEDIVIPVLRRAYKLSNVWQISGLEALNNGVIRHIYGSFFSEKPTPNPPALHSVVFEIEPGQVQPSTKKRKAAEC